jgi:hypothetical protein
MPATTYDWANPKIQEGIDAFLAIVTQYGNFTAELIPLTYPEDIGFEAIVSWKSPQGALRQVPFSIHWNLEPLFNADESPINTWQFGFEDSGFAMTAELFYMELFQKVDQLDSTQQVVHS